MPKDFLIVWNYLRENYAPIISTCALGLTIYQAQLVRKNNIISKRPCLTGWISDNIEEGTVVIELSNSGIGPALIEAFEVSVDGQSVDEKASKKLECALHAVFAGFDAEYSCAHMLKGYCMGEKEKRVLVNIKFHSPFPTKQDFDRAMLRVDITIKYKSFYEEAFAFRSEDFKDLI